MQKFRGLTLTLIHFRKDRIAAWEIAWRRGELTDPSYVALYILAWQWDLFGGSGFGRSSYRSEKFSAGMLQNLLGSDEYASLPENLRDFFDKYTLKSMRASAQWVIRTWLKKDLPLYVTDEAACAVSMLKAQASGKRPVALIASAAMENPIYDKRNGFEFAVHDLEHAHKFCAEPESFKAQVTFYQGLAKLYDNGWFDFLLAEPSSKAKIEYMMSDMNTHWLHALQYCRATLLEFYLDAEGKSPQEVLSQEGANKLDRKWRDLGAGFCIRNEDEDIFRSIGLRQPLSQEAYAQINRYFS